MEWMVFVYFSKVEHMTSFFFLLMFSNFPFLQDQLLHFLSQACSHKAYPHKFPLLLQCIPLLSVRKQLFFS